MKDLKQQIKDTEKELNDVRYKLYSLRQEYRKKEIEPSMRKLIGKCYKYMNSFGGDECWPLYSMVVDFSSTWLLVNRFQKMSDGRIEIEFEHPTVLENLGEEIEIKEFQEEFKSLMKTISKITNKGGDK